RLRTGASAAAETKAGTLVEGTPAHHHVGDAGRDGHRGMHHRARRRPAAVMYAGKEAEVTDAYVSGDVDLVTGVHREGDHAVDIAGRQAGVVECGTDRLARQLQLATPGFLGELGLADTHDRAAAGQRTVHASAPSSRLRTAVPETGSPRLLDALKVTSPKYSSAASS